MIEICTWMIVLVFSHPIPHEYTRFLFFAATMTWSNKRTNPATEKAKQRANKQTNERTNEWAKEWFN